MLIALPAMAVTPAHAENDNPLWQWNKKNKQKKAKAAATEKSPDDDFLPSANNWQNSASGGKATTVTEIVMDENVSPMLSPVGALGLQAALSRYQAIVAAGGWPTVPNVNLKKGAEGEAVAALNRRLFVEDYVRREATEGEFAAVFTTATAEALTRFQRNHGLKVSGALDSATAKALNVPATRRLATIRANIPRLDEYSKDVGPRYIIVNVPAAQLETVAGGRVYSRHNIIVGRPSRPTPVVMTTLSEINFNPYWNAPASIVERDIIPKMLKGGARSVMTQMNMKVFEGVGGPEIDPESVDWERAIADDFHFRQEPGGSNAMATAKISFPSPFGIYLHDTPEKHLFAAGQRFFSSGCVRVEQVQTFLNWILSGQDYFDVTNQDSIDESLIAELGQSLERRDVKLTNPPQLRVTYLTAWTNTRGEVNFRPDIYALDGTGFVMGQPLPVGEMGEDGLRYVLKPVPRQPAAVEEAEFEGFFLFGFRPSNRSDRKAKTTEMERPAATNWTQTKSGVKKKTVKAAAAKNDGKKKPKTAAKKKIVKQDGQAAAKKKTAKQPEQAATKKIVKQDEQAAAVKEVEPVAKPCTPDILGDLSGDCGKPGETAANRD